MPDRSDKFTYTDPRQIRVLTEEEARQARARRELDRFLREQEVDCVRLLDFLREHIEDFRHEDGEAAG